MEKMTPEQRMNAQVITVTHRMTVAHLANINRLNGKLAGDLAEHAKKFKLKTAIHPSQVPKLKEHERIIGLMQAHRENIISKHKEELESADTDYKHDLKALAHAHETKNAETIETAYKKWKDR